MFRSLFANPFLSGKEKFRVARELILPPRWVRSYGRLAARTAQKPPMDVEQSLTYAQSVAADYLSLLDGPPKGLNVLEIGTGRHLGVSVRLLSLGARTAATLDRFPLVLEPWVMARELEVVKRMRAAQGDGLTDLPERLFYFPGVTAESMAGRLPNRHYDLILSRAVLEHVNDLDTVFQQQAKLLAPGGRALHFVDLRGHGFSGARHTLGWLTLPRAFQKLADRYGYPNRQPLSAYLNAARKSKLWLKRVLVTRLAGMRDRLKRPLMPEEVSDQDWIKGCALAEQVRDRLPQWLRGISLAELALQGVVLDFKNQGTGRTP